MGGVQLVKPESCTPSPTARVSSQGNFGSHGLLVTGGSPTKDHRGETSSTQNRGGMLDSSKITRVYSQPPTQYASLPNHLFI